MALTADKNGRNRTKTAAKPDGLPIGKQPGRASQKSNDKSFEEALAEISRELARAPVCQFPRDYGQMAARVARTLKAEIADLEATLKARGYPGTRQKGEVRLR